MNKYDRRLGNRTLYLRKANNNEESDLIQTHLSNFFSDPKLYFDSNIDGNKIIIGKNQTGPRCDCNNNLVPYSVVGPVARGARSLVRMNSRKSVTGLSSRRNSSHLLTPSNLANKEKNTEMVSDNQINDIFDNYKKLKLENLKRTNDFLEHFDFRIKPDMKQIFLRQERTLEQRNASCQNLNKIKQRLVLKTKKSESSLLINQNENYRIKREVIDTLDSQNKTIETRYGKDNWIMGLRRPLNFQGKRFAYINRGTERNPHWTQIKEEYPEIYETVRNPDVSEDQAFKTFRGQSLESFHKSLDGLKV